MPTETPDLVAEHEAQQSDTPDLVQEFEQQKTAPQRPDFTQEALSGKLAQPAGAPTKLPAEQPAPTPAIPRGRGDVSQAKGGYFPPTDIPIQGVKDIKEGYEGFSGLPVPLKAMPAARGQMPRPVQPQAQVSPEDQEVLTQQENQRAASAAKMIQGAGEVGTVALPGALAAAPLSTVASIGAGVLSSKAAGKAVHGKVSPEAEDLVKATAFFIPSVLGTMAGVKAASMETPKGKFSAVEALGGKVRAGIARTPDVTSGRVKIGDTQFEVNIPRGGQPAPPPALDEATAAMVQYEQAAGNMPKPPPPVPPGQQFGNKLSGDQVDHLAQAIAKAPPDQQNSLIEEAHANMAKWINDNNGKVFIDGKVVLAKSPDQVEALSAKIINDASSAHDKNQIDLAKANDKAVTAQKKEAEKQDANTKQPPQTLYSKAINLIIESKDATTDNLSSNLKIAKKEANDLLEEIGKDHSLSAFKQDTPAPKPAAAPAKVDAQPKTEAPQSQPATEKPSSQIAKNEVPDLVAQHEATQSKKLPDYITENRGRWFTPDEKMATGYAREGKLYAVDVPADVAKQTDETRVPGRPEHILPDVWKNKSRPVEELGEPPAGTVRLFRGEAPREEPAQHEAAQTQTLTRHGNKGEDLSTEKPHGLYLTLDRAGVPSAHEDVGPEKFTGDATGQNVLDLEPSKVKHGRFAEFESGQGSAGVLALKHLSSPEEFNGLLKMKKPELVAKLNSEFPGHDYSKYYDSYELLEALGAQRARKTGYDALSLRDKDSAHLNANFDEYVALKPSAVKFHEATPDLVAEHEKANERLPENAARRKEIEKMSGPEKDAEIASLRKERTTAKLDNSDGTFTHLPIPSAVAFHEAPPSKAVGMSDADGLKAVNDKYGYKAGNALLLAKAEALKEAGLDAYHQKGDEFLGRGDSTEDVKAKFEKARDILRNREFTVTDADGKQVTMKGVDFSYGTGKDLAEAQAGLHAHKAERKAAGAGARGEFGRISETGSQAADHGGTKEVTHPLPEGIPAKGQAGRVPLKSLTLAPKEFQYKLNTNEHGVTNLLSGQKWNDSLAGVVSIWHNPANGKTYVVNGHHRVQLAKQNGQKDLLAQHLNVNTASEVRAMGALQNIAEGRGTAVDAAKFFRERGITPADLEKHGVSMGEATAENGLALSKLDPYLFDKVVSGELPQGRGIAIGKSTDNPATQEAILKLIEKAEKRGRRITDGQVAELARFAGRAKETTVAEGGLFGTSYKTENNALDKAEVSDYIKQKLSQEKRVFGAVSSEGKAEVLGQVKGQNIKAGANQKIALEAAQAGELYDKLSSSRGPIDDILESAAQRIAKRENPATVKADAYKQARAELRKTLPGVEGQGTERVQKDSDRRSGNEEADRQASVKQNTDLQEFRNQDSTKEQNFQQYLAEQGINEPDLHGMLGPSGKMSGRAERAMKSRYNEGHAEVSKAMADYQKAIDDGDIVDPTGKFKPIPKTDVKAEEAARLRARANQLQSMAERGMRPVKFRQEAAKLREQADALEPALPGMAPHIEANKESAAATQGEDLSKKLTETKSISAKTGEMERNSPLFRDSEASGQSGLFGDSSIKGKPSERGFASMDIPEVLARGVAEPVASFVKDTIKQTAEARSVDDKLFGLGKQYEADVLRAIELMKQVGPLSTPADQAAIYHHLEDSSVTLDPKQQAVLDKIVKPLMSQSSAIRSELNSAGVPMGEEGYVHRVVQGRSSQLERAMRGKQGTGKGNVLSKSAASLKQRKMFALEDEHGNRQVVAMEGGRITGFKNGAPDDMGASPRLQVGDNFNDKTGKPWTLQQATTKEIEASTNLKYYKNALASAVTDYLQLLRAKRANDALESMKADPGFNQMAFKSEKGSMPPDGWQPVNLPQFRDYYFEPHMAEVLNRFAKELHPDPVTFLEKVGNFMTASLLLNPVRHIYNIGNHWLVERGVSGVFNPLTWPTGAKAGMKAIKAVVNQNDDFLSALDHGAPMMSHRTDLQALHHELFQTIVGHLEKNPSIANKIAEFVGYEKTSSDDTGVVNAVARGTGLRMLNNIRKLGQKAMWMSNDMMMLQSAYEKMAGGSSFEDAMAQTEKHIPNYRIPTRIMNSKAMGDFMGSRLASMFGRYHYGVWKSYGEMAKEALSPGSTPKERLKGLDHIIMLGLITFIMYPLWKKVLEKLTGNKDARMVVSGASAAPHSISEIIKGNEDPSQLLRNTFTPAILPQAAAEAMFNRDFFSGAPVRNPKHSAGKQAIDVSKHFMNALGPVQQYNQATRNSHPTRSFLLSQVGVSTSHPKKHR